MAIKAYSFFQNSYLRRALIVSAVGHGVVLVMLLVSPRWFPVPDTSASTMDAIEVQLFSAIVSGAVSPEYASPSARALTEDALPSTPDSTRETEVPKPVSPSPREELTAEKAEVSSPKPTQKVEVPESMPPRTSVTDRDSVVAPTPEPVQVAEVVTPPQTSPPVQRAEAEILIDPRSTPPVITPKVPPVPVVPPKSKPVQVAKADRVPLPDLKVPEVSDRKSVDTLLASIKAGRVPESLRLVVPLPEAPKLAQLSDRPAMLPETMESPEILERVQAEINAAMKDVDLPAAVDPSARVVNPLPDAPKVAPVPQPEEMQAAAAAAVAETKARVQAEINAAMKDVDLPAAVDPSARVVNPLPDAPKVTPVSQPEEAQADAAKTKARVQGGVMKIVDDTAVPEPMDLSSPPEHLDVAAVPPSTSSAPPLSSEIKLLLDGLVAGQNRGDEQGSKGSDEYAQWTDRVRLIIDRNWYSPPKVELSVLVGFRISSDGRVGQVVIKESSGNHVFDKAAMRAVKQSKRLPPFPAEIQKEFLDVVYKFSKIPEGAKRS